MNEIQLKLTKLEQPQNRVDMQKPILELEPEFDGSNPYMKFERNLIKMS